MLSKLALLPSLLLIGGCATSPLEPVSPPMVTPAAVGPLRGSYYRVQPGETLWRIAHDFGLDAETLGRANHLTNAAQIKAGQQLFIPSPRDSGRFSWPARGAIAARSARGSHARRSVEIRAPQGSFVRASRGGRVAVAAHSLAGWGKTVIVDHGDGFLTVYAGLEQLLVGPGAVVEQGNPLGRLGQEPLHFEIRYGTHPNDPLRLLP